jgi:uncharacterized protein (DUF58 family)
MAERLADPAALLDPAFVESLAHLRLVARRVPRGGRFADQVSNALGSGLEFKDYRPYTPGDDLRAIDWNVYRRMGRVFVRLFEELEDLPVHLVVDVSKSLFATDAARGRAALRSALALGAIALGQHDTVGVYPFSDDLAVARPPTAGKGRVFGLARAMAAIEVGGATDVATSLRRFGALRVRRGLCVIVSDFFDPRGIEALREGLRSVKHRLLFVQIHRASDARPELAGDVRLVDAEGGTTLDVSVTQAVLARYRAAYERFQADLVDTARARGAGLVRIDADQPVVPQLAAVFEGGVLRT